MSEFYNLSAVNNKGQTVQMSDFKGKPVLIFNSGRIVITRLVVGSLERFDLAASSCSFTTQLSGLQELHKKYSDRGLQVIGFPCNQFASQDSGTCVYRS